MSVMTGHYHRAKGQAEVTGSSETEASAQGDPRAVSEHGQHPCWGPHPHLLSSQEGAAYSVKGKPYVKVGARLSVTD